LLGGILFGILLLNDFNLFASFEALYTLFISLLSKAWILKTLGFAILVGSIMALIQKSGGIGGFVDFMLHKIKLVRSQRSALMLSYAIGIFIFIESSITSLIAGAVGKPFCDKYKIPYAKLAFVCDSTSAPVSSLIVLNGWGALLLGLISTQIISYSLDIDAVSLLIDSVLHNFYAMSALVVTFIFVWFDIEIGLMKKVKYKAVSDEVVYKNVQSMYYMLIPIVLMVLFVFVFLYISGDGNILKGSGSTSIFYTVLTTLIFMFFYYTKTKNMSTSVWFKTALRGAKHLFPIAMILLFAFGIGEVTTKLKVGEFLASLANSNLDIHLVAPMIFLLASVISFSTGTSWGTFSIMIPIAMPMAINMDADLALCVGAVISGGIFGDHCSPISDTTIISSMASECDVVEHVNTQLPYALLSAFISFLLFFVFGFNIS